MRGRADARIRGDRATEVVERALERHQLGLQQLELHAVHPDLMERVVCGCKELDVRVEDAERVDRRHQLRHLLLQRRDERPELLDLAGRARLDPHRDALAHPHRDPLERSPRDRADHRGDRALRPHRERWRRPGGSRQRRLPERRPQVGDVLGGEIGIGAAHAVRAHRLYSAQLCDPGFGPGDRARRAVASAGRRDGRRPLRLGVAIRGRARTVVGVAAEVVALLDQSPSRPADRRAATVVGAECLGQRDRVCYCEPSDTTMSIPSVPPRDAAVAASVTSGVANASAWSAVVPVATTAGHSARSVRC